MSVALPWILTVISFGVALANGAIWTRARLPHVRVLILGLLFAVLSLFWLPREARDWTVVGTLSLVAFLAAVQVGEPHAAVVAPLVAAMLLKALLTVLPGGGSVLVALAGLTAIASALVPWMRRVSRARAAQRLTPNQDVTGDVEVSGEVVCEQPLTTPGGAHRCAAWRFSAGDQVVQSKGDVHLETPAGRVRITAINADLDFSHHVEHLDLEAARAVVRDGGLHVLVTSGATLSWIEPGDQGCVVGRPQWVVSPEASRGYRDSAYVPVFSTTIDSRTLLATGDTQALIQSARLRLMGWVGWSGLLALIAGLQMADVM